MHAAEDTTGGWDTDEFMITIAGRKIAGRKMFMRTLLSVISSSIFRLYGRSQFGNRLPLGSFSAWLFLTCLAELSLAIQNPPAQWRLIWKSDPATTATISWSTSVAGESHTVRFRERTSGEKLPLAEIAAQNNGQYCYSNNRFSLHYHHAHLTQLKPETAYDIEIVSDGRTSPHLYFVTAPSRSRPFSILYGADSRSDVPRRQAMNARVLELVVQSRLDSDPAEEILALAHGGDYVRYGARLDMWSQWMTDHESTISQDGRLLPIIPCRGNHDRGMLYAQVFDFDIRDDNYYVTTFADQLHLITLNTETSIAGDQTNWLREQLAVSRASANWIVAQYHRPAYPSTVFPSGSLTHWVPLFEQFNVDLVCEADGHTIKRTLPIRDNQYDETGVVYIGEGGLGVGPRKPKMRRWYLQPPGMASSGHHVQKITCRDDRLTIRCILENGDVVDSYERYVRHPNSSQAP